MYLYLTPDGIESYYTLSVIHEAGRSEKTSSVVKYYVVKTIHDEPGITEDELFRDFRPEWTLRSASVLRRLINSDLVTEQEEPISGLLDTRSSRSWTQGSEGSKIMEDIRGEELSTIYERLRDLSKEENLTYDEMQEQKDLRQEWLELNKRAISLPSFLEG